MIVLTGALIGIALGAFLARRRGGTRWDMAQYAASMGIALALVGMIATVVIHRAMV